MLRAWVVALYVVLPAPGFALPALQVTELTGELEVQSESRRLDKLPYIASGSEVRVVSGRASFEAPVHARIEAMSGDRFSVRHLSILRPGVQVEAIGASTRLRVRMGNADLVVPGGSVVALDAYNGRGRFHVLKPPVEVRASLGPGESMRVSTDRKVGMGPLDSMALHVPKSEGFAAVPLEPALFQASLSQLPAGAVLTASRLEAPAAPAAEDALLAKAVTEAAPSSRKEAQAEPLAAPEGDLRLAAASKPGTGIAPVPGPEVFPQPIPLEPARLERMERKSAGEYLWLAWLAILGAGSVFLGWLWSRRKGSGDSANLL